MTAGLVNKDFDLFIARCLVTLMFDTDSDLRVALNGSGCLPLHVNGRDDVNGTVARANAAELLQSPDLAAVDSKELLRELLRRIGDDPDREGLQQTPDRIVRSWNELYAGYAQRAEDILVTQFQAEHYDEMVLLRDIDFFSTCEHHMLPFYGKAHIAYLPDEKIVGLSKLARLTDMYARRLQVQERLTYQVAVDLQRVLKPKGVAVMMEAKHHCMCSRGVGKQNGKMVTSCLLGAFKENLASRTEFLALVKS